MTASSSRLNSSLFTGYPSAFSGAQMDPTFFLKNVYKIPGQADYAETFKPYAGYSTLELPTPGSGPTTEFGNPYPAEDDADLRRSMRDFQYNRALMDDYFKKTQMQNLTGMLTSYPILSQAAWDATRRNLYSSKDWRAFLEGTPTYQANVNATYQGMRNAASEAEARMMNAVANQNIAAVNFGTATIPRLG